jgi:hypothetical protein
MRRFLIVTPLLFALSACASGTTAAVNPIPLSGLPPVAGVQLVGARQALVDFLNGYAKAGNDDGRSLEQLVAGGPPELRDWVTWLIVQNRSNLGMLTGTANIGAIRFQDFVTILGRIPGATFSLDATVTLTYRPPNAAPVVVTHDFSGDATVFQRSPGDWGVYDVTRDGRSMDSSIFLVNGLSVAGHDLDVHVRSVWNLQPFFSFNVTVENHGAQAVSFDDAKTALVGASATDVTPSQSHTSGLDHIPAGGTASGTINFGPLSPATSSVVVAFDPAKGPPVELSVSLNRLANAIPAPPTAAPASPSPAG